MPRCAPMRPCNADEATRPINGVVASNRSPTSGKRNGGRGNAAWPTRGTEGRSGQAIGMQRLTSPCQPSFLPHWKTQPPQSERAPRDSDPPTCRPRPRAVAHVTRPALPRAPPPARVRLAGPDFLSRADPSPQRRAPASGPSHSSERSIEFESSTDTHGRGAAR
jgi:hypothetical protein